MSTTLTIKGMHCAACEALITMELEEVGLADKIMSLRVATDNTGILELDNATDEEIQLAKSTIQKMDSYSID